jgi:hypothetical protein
MNEDVALQKVGANSATSGTLRARDEYIPANTATGRAQNVASIYNI